MSPFFMKEKSKRCGILLIRIAIEHTSMVDVVVGHRSFPLKSQMKPNHWALGTVTLPLHQLPHEEKNDIFFLHRRSARFSLGLINEQ